MERIFIKKCFPFTVVSGKRFADDEEVETESGIG
jgi:hypothetical protein